MTSNIIDTSPINTSSINTSSINTSSINTSSINAPPIVTDWVKDAKSVVKAKRSNASGHLRKIGGHIFGSADHVLMASVCQNGLDELTMAKA